MSPVVFIDTNIPIYASGREHLYKEPCARIMRIASEVADGVRYER